MNDFLKDVVESNDFYYLPQSIQLLYFHMIASSDEKGNCVPKEILDRLHIPYSYLYPLIEAGYIVPIILDGTVSERVYLVSAKKSLKKNKYNTKRQCLYINGILRNRCTSYYNEKRGLFALFLALQNGVDMEQITHLCKRIDSWTQFVNLMDSYGIQV